MDLEKLLTDANGRLREKRCRCRIQQRRKALVLRATLPTKQGDQQRQQRIPIGVPATAAGLTEAEFKALKLDTELRSGSFDWRNWIERDEEKPAQVAAVSRDEFLAAGKVLHTRKVTRKAKRDPRAEARGVESWRKRWQCALNKVPKGEVTEKKIIAVVKEQEEGSAARREAGLVLGMVAAEFGWDQKAIRSAGAGYGRRMLKRRDIPTEQEIEEAFDTLRKKSPHWARVWGLVATYGTRPSELGSAKLRSDGVLLVEDSKTNRPRAVTPTKSSWIERFELQTLPEPPGRKDGYSISTNCNAARRRAGIEIPLYNLRHAAAIRLLRAGVPAELAAKLMGHSAAMFTETYTAWISEETIIEAMGRYRL